jgi:hypothetical protein
MYNAAQRLGEMKRNFIKEWPMIYDSDELEVFAASGDVFSVEVSEVVLYPAFQLDENHKPYPAVKDILALAAQYGIGSWSLALWFTIASPQDAANRKPVDLLTDSKLLAEIFMKLLNSEENE